MTDTVCANNSNSINSPLFASLERWPVIWSTGCMLHYHNHRSNVREDELMQEQNKKTPAWLKHDMSRCNSEYVFPVAGFLLKQQNENSSGFKGCMWTSTTHWRRPYSNIYRHSNHLKHEDIYSIFRSLHDIYYTLDSYNNYVLHTK